MRQWHSYSQSSTALALLSVNTAKPIGPPGPGFIQCDAGMFAGRTIRAEVNEVQKANVGKKCVLFRLPSVSLDLGHFLN